MGTVSHQSFKSCPSIARGFSVFLLKIGDVSSSSSIFRWWEELFHKLLYHLVPGGDLNWFQRICPLSHLISEGEWEQRQLDVICSYVWDDEGIADFDEAF